MIQIWLKECENCGEFTNDDEIIWNIFNTDFIIVVVSECIEGKCGWNEDGKCNIISRKCRVCEDVLFW